MKLLILTCLVAAALAMPRVHPRNVVFTQTQQQQSSSEEDQEIVKQPKYVSLTEVIMDASTEEAENAIPNITEEQLQKQIKYNQLHQQVLLAQGHPMSVVDQPVPQFLQYAAYPLWAYVPQDMQNLTPEAVLNTFKSVVPKDAEKNNMWWYVHKN
ncbi:alpha-S1-casein [Apodemus sylvaticus]|uniref:alpha-S1-casein n=1 Tax=Apodemus sylvaticus TaxID=10129 RepID=UPI0022423E70|nr:alpha-S1-casein [Apodemus sylvaticus]